MQAQSVLRHPSPIQGEKPIQQVVQDDEKAPLNIRRFSLHAEFGFHYVLSFNHLLIYGSVQIVQVQGLRTERQNSSCSTSPCDAPSTRGGQRSADTEEPCGASHFLSSRVGGE